MEGTYREHRVAEAVAAAASAVHVYYCRKRRTMKRRRWLASAEAARRRRCCKEHRGGDDGDGAGDVAVADDDPRLTSRAVACWTVQSEVHMTGVVQPVPATRMIRRAVVKPSVNGKNRVIWKTGFFSTVINSNTINGNYSKLFVHGVLHWKIFNRNILFYNRA